MKNVREYGRPPFGVAVVHGGPGAPGEMAPVARELASERGVLEPLQTAATLEGQVEELRTVLEERGDLPLALIGFSWGTWLSFILAANHPALVRRLILVGSGPFEERYAGDITKVRLSRLGEGERTEALCLIETLNDRGTPDKDSSLARFGELMAKADSYDPLPQENEVLECRYEIYRGVWEDARILRSSGRLLELGGCIRCPVVAIHGDYDPHPFRGVEEPLSQILKEFRLVLLRKCGHRPWIERAARDRFYEILKEELG